MDVFASGATTMEIDPHKVDEASDTTINSLELWLVAQKLFKCIVDSERIMPTQIKQLMHHIDSEVGARFSAQAQFRALGGFLFLRMVCPALMAPQVYGLLDAPPHPVRSIPHTHPTHSTQTQTGLNGCIPIGGRCDYRWRSGSSSWCRRCCRIWPMTRCPVPRRPTWSS
jgi:hypothetical protein